MRKIVSLFFVLVALFFVFSGQFDVDASSTAPSTVVVNAIASFDDDNLNIENNPVNASFGSEVTISFAGLPSEYSFAFWIVDGVVRTDLNSLSQNTFVATSNLEVIAVFHPNAQRAVVFVDANGKLIETKYVDANDDVLEPSILPTKIGYTYATNKWLSITGSESLAVIELNTVFKLQYQRTTTDIVNITVIGGTASNLEPTYNDIVTLEATLPGFTHWEENGVVLSYETPYSFSALYDRTIEAKTGGVAKPVITLGSDLELRTGYVSKVGQFYVPSGYEVIEYGYLVSKSFEQLIYSSATHVVKSSTVLSQTNEFLMSIPDEWVHIRAYAIVDNGVTTSVVYSESLYNYVIIYEVYGGGGNSGAPYKNDYVVLYNPTDNAMLI
jgi:hypothetical protein